jgi:hypothetical protein
MKREHDADFLRNIFALTQAFRIKPLTPEQLEIYSRALADVEIDALSRACEAAVAACEHFPSVATLRRLAGCQTPAAAEALLMARSWEAVRAARRRHSYTVGVDFGPVVNAVIRNMGGWVELCGKTNDEMVWARKHFEELFPLFQRDPSLVNNPLRGTFGGLVRVAIEGARTVPAGAPHLVAAHVAALAEAKS